MIRLLIYLLEAFTNGVYSFFFKSVSFLRFCCVIWLLWIVTPSLRYCCHLKRSNLTSPRHTKKWIDFVVFWVFSLIRSSSVFFFARKVMFQEPTKFSRESDECQKPFRILDCCSALYPWKSSLDHERKSLSCLAQLITWIDPSRYILVAYCCDNTCSRRTSTRLMSGTWENTAKRWVCTSRNCVQKTSVPTRVSHPTSSVPRWKICTSTVRDLVAETRSPKPVLHSVANAASIALTCFHDTHQIQIVIKLPIPVQILWTVAQQCWLNFWR